jgi:uncharacterized delta-60 repeat protein
MTRVAAAPGALDLSFGRDGAVRLAPLPPVVGQAVRGVFTQKPVPLGDGRMYGLVEIGIDEPDRRAAARVSPADADAFLTASDVDARPHADSFYNVIVRLTADGHFDPTFSRDGRIRIDDANGEIGLGLLSLADGSSIVGRFRSDGGTWWLVLMRLTRRGVVDSAFGTGGLLQVKLNSGGAPDYVDFGADATGRLVLLRTGTIQRFTPTGGVDTGFGDNGEITFPVRELWDLDVADDGTVTVGWTRSDDTGLARFRASDGAPDPTFSGDGFALVRSRGGGTFRKVVRDSVDRYVVVYDFALGRASGQQVRRVSSNGLPDGAFADAVIPGAFGANVSVGAELDGRDRAVVTVQGPGASASINRVAPDGGLDPTFGRGGRRLFANAFVYSEVDDSNRIVVDLARVRSTGPTQEIARLRRDGGLDARFGRGGIVDTRPLLGTFIGNLGTVADTRIILSGFRMRLDKTGSHPDPVLAALEA